MSSCYFGTHSQPILAPNPGAVPPIPLRRVQCAVRSPDDGASVIVRQSLRDASAEGIAKISFIFDELGRRKTLPDPVDDAHGILELDPWKDQQELLATDPPQDVLPTDPLATNLCKVPEDSITCIVAMRVINSLEVVNVD